MSKRPKKHEHEEATCWSCVAKEEGWAPPELVARVIEQFDWVIQGGRFNAEVCSLLKTTADELKALR